MRKSEGLLDSNNTASKSYPMRSFSPLQNPMQGRKVTAGQSVMMPLNNSLDSISQNQNSMVSGSMYSVLDLPDLDKELYVRFLPKKWDEKSVEWQEKDHCYLCNVSFSKVTLNNAKKRTHCRRCGNSVCRLCCSNELQLCQINPKKEKVCNACCAEIQNLHVRSLYRQILDKGKATLQFLIDARQEK